MAKESQIHNNLEEDITLEEFILKFHEWRRYLTSNWLIILVLSLLGGVAGYFYATSKKVIYTATTTFVLEEGGSSGGLGNLGSLASVAGIDLGGGSGGLFQGDNILELYKSRLMIEKTLFSEVKYNEKKVLLINRYIEFNGLRGKWTQQSLGNIQFQSSDFQENEKTPDRLKDSIIGTIVNDIKRNYLKVSKPDIKLSIISADVRSNDEFFAKTFNDQIVKNVNDFYVQTKTKKSLENVVILQQKTDSVRAVMNGAIYSAAAILDATPNLNPTRQVQRIAPAQRSEFSAETNKAILNELVKNLEMSKMGLLKETPLIQVIDQPILPLSTNKTNNLMGIIIGFVFIFILMGAFFSIKFLFKTKI